jgi:hypothetical protein
MEPTVSLGFSECRDRATGAKSARIVVTNVGNDAIRATKLEFVYEYETPLDVAIDLKAEIRVSETATRLSFSPAESDDLPLAVGERRDYFLPVQFAAAMRSVVESLSTERYSIQLTLDGKEETGIPGERWGDFVARQLGDDAPE